MKAADESRRNVKMAVEAGGGSVELEDIPVADTVLVLQSLAARRGFAAELSSPLLPD